MMTPIFLKVLQFIYLTDFEYLADLSTEIYISSSLFWPFL